jgi:hypothetical protein
LLVSINPISGDRNDSNTMAFRSFLVEIDKGDLWEQKEYIEKLGMPHSVCVFSGNKSLHFGIVLKESLPDVSIWRIVNEWILSIVTEADQQTKNPSRSIRFPDNLRNDGKKLQQKLISIGNRIDQETLFAWLNQFPEANPKYRNIVTREPLGDIEYNGIPGWMADKLNEGVGQVGSRNLEWFLMSINLANRGADEQAIIEALGPFFIPAHDFTLREWQNCIKSAIKVSQRGSI